MGNNIARSALLKYRRASQVLDDRVPVRHGPFLRHADHWGNVATCPALAKFADVLLDTHPRLLTLDISGRDPGICMCNLVLIHARSGFPEKFAASVSRSRWLPIDPAILSSNGEAFGVGWVVRPSQLQDRGRTKGHEVIAPFIWTGQLFKADQDWKNIPSIISSPSISPPRMSVWS